MDKLDAVVIGAGVVGLAIARALALAGREVLVLEKNPRFGEETSARNSEVIHAGLYYPQGSLKARTCVKGNRLLYAYCDEKGIAYQQCGKLLVATAREQLDQLKALQIKAQVNGCVPLEWRSKQELAEIEPELQAEAALLSPSTGILDSHGLMLALLTDLEAAGGQLVTANAVTGGRLTAESKVLELDGFSIAANLVVNAAGLQAPELARCLQGDQPWIPRPYFAKGNYFSLSGKNPFKHLIYPLPEAAGLGIHLTLDLQGRARFGPDVEWLEAQKAAGLDFSVDPQRQTSFVEAIRYYWPGLPADALQPDYSGIRPKLGPPGSEAKDFQLLTAAQHACPGVLHLFGIESPGLTASLALADEATQQLLTSGV
ncbi:L-2-hydroxyglutarate oxidase LhgO [Marinospirillum celere]|uniref:L-2-hydroxyglutarate oxidase LhgO n=1 Tax=Marinospirillum celere TaxID=1122252 RepID=A0A1I1J0F9_9GAMM|nr:NAD(P)/FAD-dependent oxidoreductase [Marinospirillum celere]SFC41895.1 L-2-hydroxyglutarate oxidase LhgO [Marinospirillum celere]